MVNIGSSKVRNDYGQNLASDSGPYLMLMAAAVSLARADLDRLDYSEEARDFLNGDLVETFAECIGFGGSFIG